MKTVVDLSKTGIDLSKTRVDLSKTGVFLSKIEIDVPKTGIDTKNCCCKAAAHPDSIQNFHADFEMLNL